MAMTEKQQAEYAVLAAKVDAIQETHRIYSEKLCDMRNEIDGMIREGNDRIMAARQECIKYLEAAKAAQERSAEA